MNQKKNGMSLTLHGIGRKRRVSQFAPKVNCILYSSVYPRTSSGCPSSSISPLCKDQRHGRAPSPDPKEATC